MRTWPLERACRVAIVAVLLSFALASTGCVRYEVVHYQPLTKELDGSSELHISSYPSWFPKETSHIPFISKTLRTPETIYFQVSVREAGKKSGPNPHVRSIRIRSFSYQRSGLPPVQLISDHGESFWMQGQPGSNPGPTQPVPCVPGVPIRVAISLELNGTDYAFEDEMACAVRESSGLLLVHALAS